MQAICRDQGLKLAIQAVVLCDVRKQMSSLLGELRLQINQRDVGLYGSRGQARTAVLSLKLAELDWMHEAIGEWPILLLDEVVAGLDADRRMYLLERINGATQSILTTTDPDVFTDAFLQEATLWHVVEGQVRLC